MHAMKRRLPMLLAALSAAIASPAMAQIVTPAPVTPAPVSAASPPSGDPGKMFMINAVTPGVVSFSGEGTAQFNNSSSTANSFSVGSATQFGVNASASATADYMVDANAQLNFGAGAQLQQTIGTSSSAANTMAASEAAATAATTIANQKTTEEFGQNWADYLGRNGVATSSTGAVTGSTEGLEFKTQNNYEANKKSFMDKQTQEAYANTTQTATASSQNGASGNGIISGEFLTTNKSTSSIGATAGVVAENTTKASQEADAKFGKSYDDYKLAFNAVAGSGGINTEAEKQKASALGIMYNTATGAALTNDSSGSVGESWENTKTNFSDEKFTSLSKAASSSGNASNESTAVVTVTGVGSIATLNAADSSSFNVDVATRIRNQLMENNATANGSAGGSLNTVSMANQSNSTSASAFMQAFGADTVKLNAAADGLTLQSATVNGRFNVTLDASGADAVIALPNQK